MSIFSPLPHASEKARRLAALIFSVGLLAAPVSYVLVRLGWLTRLGAISGFGAIEFATLAVAVATMLRSVDANARAIADTMGRRRAIDNLQSQAATLLEEISLKSRELDAANSNLRAATEVNALLAMAAQQMPNAVIIADGQGTILWTNVAWETLSGMTQADSVRRPVNELLGRAMNGFGPEEGRRLIEIGQSAAIESKDTSPQGDTRWFSVAFQPVRNLAQEVVNFIVLIDDFTAFHEAHLRQRYSEEISIQVSRLAKIGAWEYLAPAQAMRWEPELFRICQVELGYLPTLEKMAAFFPENEREAFLRTVHRAIREGHSFDMECPLITAHGEKRWVQIFGWPEIKAGKTVRLFGTIQDISGRHDAESAQRTLENQLFQLQKMETLGTLAGGIAHDFNNLLTGIIGNQDLAMEDLDPQHPARPRLEEARTASLLACELVEQILTFSRQTEGDRVSTDLAVVIEEARRFLRSSVPTSIQIEVKVEPGCGRVMADVAQLNQLLLNLGSNGGHAMRSTGGVLSISLSPTVMTANQAAAHGNLPLGRYVRINVRDTGHGMDAETQRRIFNPFFTTKTGGEGTGLGMAIVQGIVRAHGGGIDVVSAPDSGTSVDVYLPVVDADAEEQLEALAPVSPPPRGSGELIYILDDEQIVAQAALLMLERLNYGTVVYNRPADCLAALRKESERCSLLLTDQTMPGMDGIELTRQVRAFAPDLPIIIMSGYFSKISPSALDQLGRVSLLAKPFRAGDLARSIRRALHPEEAELKPVGPA